MTQAWWLALRRGSVPLVLGLACWIASIPAIEDLDSLLKVLGGILVVLGLLIVVATGRSLADRSLAGRPANLAPEGETETVRHEFGPSSLRGQMWTGPPSSTETM